MAQIATWSGVGIAIQSALAATKTISAITKANPGVATSTAHGYTNGQEVVLDVLGMQQVDGRVVRAANVAANTFELEGVDTTLYDTFVSGTAALITFGVTLTTITASTASGGEPEFIDTTTVHDTQRSQVPGPTSPISFALESFWDPSDTGLIALKSASDAKAVRAVKLSWPVGFKYYFNGYVICQLNPTGQAQGLVTTPITVTSHGKTQAYAT